MFLGILVHMWIIYFVVCGNLNNRRNLSNNRAILSRCLRDLFHNWNFGIDIVFGIDFFVILVYDNDLLQIHINGYTTSNEERFQTS